MFRYIKTLKEKSFLVLISISGLVSLVIAGLCLFLLASQSGLALNSSSLLDLLLGRLWDPYSELYGHLPMLVGSLYLAVLASVVALPISISISLFLVAFCPKCLRNFLKAFMAMMLAVPSVVFGMWGISFFSPVFIKFELPGMNLALGVIVLFLMLVPTMTSIMLFSFEGSFQAIKKPMTSLGVSINTQVWKVILPSQKLTIIAAVVLGLAKALGETMAVLMVSGNIPDIPDSLYSPVRSLTANIALEMAYAMDEHRSSLYFSGLSLLLLVAILGLFGFLILERREEGKSGYEI